MTTLNTSISWNVGKVSGVCAACGVELPPNTTCWAALCDQPVARPEAGAPEARADGKTGAAAAKVVIPFARIDYCEKCWNDGQRPAAPLDMFSYWQTTVPLPQQKKKLLVDDAVLVDVFQRMESRSEPQEVRFRFVLALILMRKRLLKYEGMEESQPTSLIPQTANHDAASTDPAPTAPARPPELWRMLPKGSEAPVHVVNPHLTAEQITEVSQQLSAILAEEI